MHYQNTYQQTYVIVLSKSGRIVGSGIAFDEQHILTCAHVVNAALGIDGYKTDSQTGHSVSISFPLNTGLGKDDRNCEAVVETWFPRPGGMKLKYDIAILKISNPTISTMLKGVVGDVEFVSSFVSGQHNFRAVYFDTSDESSIETFGKVGIYIPSEGKTTIYPENGLIPFVQYGASGSPVYSENLKGIIGITNALKSLTLQPQAKAGFIIDSRAITQSEPTITVRHKGIAFYGDEKFQLKKEIWRKNSRYMCDRKPMVEYIGACVPEEFQSGKLPFIITNYLKQEDSDDLLIRYKTEFLDPELQPYLHTFFLRIPDSQNIDLFKYNVIGNFAETLSMGILPIKYDDTSDFYTLCSSADHLAEKPILCLIECDLDKINEGFLPCFTWLANDFLKIDTNMGDVEDLHFLFVGRYGGDDFQESLESVLPAFETEDFIHLENVTFEDITKWIDRYIEEKLRLTMRRRFQNRDYPMQEIFTLYDQINNQNLI